MKLDFVKAGVLGIAYGVLILTGEMVLVRWLYGEHQVRDALVSGDALDLALGYGGVFGLSAVIGLGASVLVRSLGSPLQRVAPLMIGGAMGIPVLIAFTTTRVRSPWVRETLLVVAVALAVVCVVWLLRSGSARDSLGNLMGGLLLSAFGASATMQVVLRGTLDGAFSPRGLVESGVGAAIGIGATLPVALIVRRGLGKVGLKAVMGVSVGCVAASALVLPLLGWRAEPVARGEDAGAPDRLLPGSVLLIVVDTLRADHVPGYGFPEGVAPALEGFVRDSVLVERVRSSSSWTLPSVGSIFTSTYPGKHRGGLAPENRRDRPIKEAARTIGQVLGRGGYFTAASLTNPVLRPETRLDMGFGVYENGIPLLRSLPIADAMLRLAGKRSQPYYRAREQTERVWDLLSQAAKGARPFFLVAHYMDPHLPYQKYQDDPPDRRSGKEGAMGQTSLAQKYLREVVYLDEYLGVLLDRLRARGWYDDLLIVLTSDHGEELDEDRGSTGTREHDHGHTVHRELIDIPLVIKLPGDERAGQRVAVEASGIDIAPTILSRLGLPVPEEFEGVDLLASPGSEGVGGRTLFTEAMLYGQEQKAAIQDHMKVIAPSMPPVGESALAYDLNVDPYERSPFPVQEGTGYWEVLVELAEHATNSVGAAEEEVPLDPAMRDQLEALGYVD